ncbi:putative FUN14 family domain-containing protein [Neospora caninum Liverpool]|uniref:FUN14 family domain-containing protein, putative n=1 Tax=Neospora caninum (strain Liverpool) TaxID=572307 RepID=F0VN24_NEOCL|nr:putative FUN14 family domain-containing protein [Neospora caninum Liverpool]CBZ55120.1 putative FUN14 family domain-containing protein [Neospora caninum Liverpool]CEL69846.1 TPA: FUN14 family domain-containing protein, putative [Neospora caninum Liverpool]|eukprot:XP_003885148.1 putative FUN14 family domain-containing protein [Neospora caninum Liverpool]
MASSTASSPQVEAAKTAELAGSSNSSLSPASSLPSSVSQAYNDSFFSRLSSNLSSYALACKNVSSVSDWMQLNNKYLGSSILYTDEISAGLIFGYCAGYAVNRALRFGALLCGIGFISVQTLSHYGYIRVNWKQVEEDIMKPLDVNGDGKFDHEDIAVIKNSFMRMMAQGLPSTAGLSFGLLYGLRASK